MNHSAIARNQGFRVSHVSNELLGGQHVVLRGWVLGLGAMYRSNQTEAWTS